MAKAAPIPEFILDVLDRHGVTQVRPSAGDPFDSKVHQGLKVASTSDESLDGKVESVIRPGFIGDGEHLVRPAQVVVFRYVRRGGSRSRRRRRSRSPTTRHLRVPPLPPHNSTRLGVTTLANKVFGIDLGTTYSCISYVDQFNQAVVVPNQDGDPTTPSAVMINADGTYAVGKSAKNELATNPDRVVVLVKRHMGEPDWRFSLDGQEYSAAQISSKILEALVLDARNNTGEAVEDVVITVPAYFGNTEREATRAAGEIAGLNVVDIINEPTAAAFTYGFAKADSAAEEAVLVYDLGGGTFDVTVMKVSSGEIDVRATDGDHELGGDDWDQSLMDLIVQKFMADNPDADDPTFDPYALGDLRLEVEGAKRKLSNTPTAKVRVTSGATAAMVEVTREEFEAATSALVEQTITLTQKCMEAAKANGITRSTACCSSAARRSCR